MAGDIATGTLNASIPYSGELKNGLVLLGYFSSVNTMYIACACYHDGNWDSLLSKNSSHPFFSSIELADGVLSFTVPDYDRNFYACVIQTDGLPTT